VTGWLSEKSQSAWGRPSDIEVLEDGSLIISDDGYAGTDNLGALYRVRAR
jgi:glucose/arabinose dehydrogenase